MCEVYGYLRTTGERVRLYRCQTAFLAMAFIRRYDDFFGTCHYLTWYGPGDGRS